MRADPPPSFSPRLRPVMLAYAAALSLCTLASGLFFSLFGAGAGGVLGSASGNGIVLLGVALVAARAEGLDVPARLRLRASRATVAGGAAAATGLLGLSFMCGATAQLLGLGGGGVMDSIARSLENASPWGLVLATIAIGLVPGAAEEVFFRGWIQPRIAAKAGKWAGILATSASFGLIHMNALQGVVAFVAGVFLGWTADQLDGVRPAILAHAVNNTAFVWLAATGASDRGSRHAELAFFAVGAAICGASVVVLRSRAARVPVNGLRASRLAS